MKISIVFPIYNGIQYTQKCLRSFYDQHKIESFSDSIHIVIVDDGSTDGSYEWINSNFPQVNVLRGNGDLWWSGGMNMGIEYAINKLETDYIVWWNNDIIASENYFKNLVDIVSGLEGKCIIGSKINLTQNKNLVWSMGGLFDPYTGKKSMIGSEKEDTGEYDKIFECDWLPGMGTVTHKSVYEDIGMLDSVNFPQYHGDSDFTFRAKAMGYKIMVHPDLQIFNDTRHSGLKHDESIKRLFNSLFSIRSNFNIKKDTDVEYEELFHYLQYDKEATSIFVSVYFLIH